MSAKEKKVLLDKLTETHIATQAILDKVDLEMLVYQDSGWRVRDIVGHIATWDQEVAKSLKSYQTGSEYVIPDISEDETDYNENAVLEQQKLTTQQILDEFKQAYKELFKAVEEMPNALFPGDVMYPWGGERGSIAQLVEYMIEHSVEHQDEIKKAMQGK